MNNVSANSDSITEFRRTNKYPKNGITSDMVRFIALIFYMGLVKKNDVKDYWFKDFVLETPFVQTVMSRDLFLNIMHFFHLADNITYPNKNSDDYDPRLKLGNLYSSSTSSFTTSWVPRQNLTIDEGCVAFKGRVAFKCYNPKKIDHIKSYKVVDSSNNYCVRFDLYVGALKKDTPVSDNRKVYDLVFRMCEPYLDQGYIIFMDNWYSSPILYHDLRKRNTGSCGTAKQNIIGFPNGFAKMIVKEKGDQRVFTYGNEMQVIKIHDRKPVTLLSNTFTATPRDSGRKHWKTKETIEKSEMMLFYNKYMGGVNVNDQLLKYSAFDHRSMKWWKKQ